MNPGHTQGCMFDRTTLFLEICSCGNSCKHCYIPDHKERFKRFGEVRAILDNFVGLLEAPAITKKAQLYFHDDPTLHPRIIEILEYATSQGLAICPTLSTNGMGLARRKNGREILDTFVQCGIKGLQLSLYGNEAYHDWFTGTPGSYHDRHATAQLAQEAGLWVCWSLFLTKDNPQQLIALARELGTNKYVSIIDPNYSVNWMNQLDLQATMAHLEIIKREAPEYLYENCCPEFATMGTVHQESEWIGLCLNGNDLKLYVENDSAYGKTMWLMEINGDLYDSEDCLPEYRVGNVFRDKLRELYRDDKHSHGYRILNDADSRWLAEQAGEPAGTVFGTMNCMRALWTSRLLARERGDA
jgi:MoaA/NifB/PqqE/SkfB family radical SAM enzyme